MSNALPVRHFIQQICTLLLAAHVACHATPAHQHPPCCAPSGKMQVLYEAVLCAPEAKAQKLVDVFKTNKKLFAALAKDQPSQLAQLIALEHTITGEATRGRRRAHKGKCCCACMEHVCTGHALLVPHAPHTCLHRSVCS